MENGKKENGIWKYKGSEFASYKVFIFPFSILLFPFSVV